MILNKTLKSKYFILGFLIVVMMMTLTACRTGDPKWEITEYSDDSGSQGLFYTLYQEKTDTLIVIDGGCTENAQHVRDVINSYGGTVTAWFVTHYHNDHVGAFNEIYADPQGIKIKQIYDSPVPLDDYEAVAQWWDGPDYYERYLELTEQAENVEALDRNDVLQFDDLTCTVLNTYDEISADMDDLPNNCSLMLKFETEAETPLSILFCADCHGEAMSDYLLETYGDSLKCDYVQLGHHGYNSLTNEFYEKVDPDVMFFDGPEWLMTGEEYDTKDRRAYFENEGITCYDFTTAPNQIIFP